MKNFEGIEIYHRAVACKSKRKNIAAHTSQQRQILLELEIKKNVFQYKQKETRLHFQAGEIFSDHLETKNEGFPVRKTFIPRCIRNNTTANHFCFTQTHTQKQQTAENQ